MRRRAIGLVGLLTALGLLHACGDGDGGGPTEPEPVPGTLQLHFTTPYVDDRGLLLRLTGPGIEAVTAPGLQLWETGTSTERRVLLAGPVANGAVLRFDVPDVEDVSRYAVTLEQVAGEGFEQRDVTEYAVAVVR